MIDFLQGIVDTFNFILSFLGMLINSFIQFLMMIPNMIIFLTASTAFVPTFLVAFFLASISISIIMAIKH